MAKYKNTLNMQLSFGDIPLIIKPGAISQEIEELRTKSSEAFTRLLNQGIITKVSEDIQYNAKVRTAAGNVTPMDNSKVVSGHNLDAVETRVASVNKPVSAVSPNMSSMSGLNGKVVMAAREPNDGTLGKVINSDTIVEDSNKMDEEGSFIVPGSSEMQTKSEFILEKTKEIQKVITNAEELMKVGRPERFPPSRSDNFPYDMDKISPDFKEWVKLRHSQKKVEIFSTTDKERLNIIKQSDPNPVVGKLVDQRLQELVPHAPMQHAEDLIKFRPK